MCVTKAYTVHFPMILRPHNRLTLSMYYIFLMYVLSSSFDVKTKFSWNQFLLSQKIGCESIDTYLSEHSAETFAKTPAKSKIWTYFYKNFFKGIKYSKGIKKIRYELDKSKKFPRKLLSMLRNWGNYRKTYRFNPIYGWKLGFLYVSYELIQMNHKCFFGVCPIVS